MNCASRNAQNKIEALDKIIGQLRNDLERTGEASLPNDIETLYALYDRLIQRHRLYASDDLIADAALFFLEEENRCTNKTDAIVAMIQSEPNFHARFQDMVDAIATILKESSVCSPDDLKAKGFSENEIDRRWEMAYALARIKLNWLDG